MRLGAVPSPRCLPRTVGKPPPIWGRKLSVSLSVNLSNGGDVQLAEAALQLAASSLGSGSHDEEDNDDRAPVR